jgi:hypothetical protein
MKRNCLMHRWIDVRGRDDLLPEEGTTIVGCLNYREDDCDFDIDRNSAIFEYEPRFRQMLTHYFELRQPRKIECEEL